MRINTFISSTGFCSRREADTYIQQQKVWVNGQLAVIGQQVQEGDEVVVDGQKLVYKAPTTYLMFNKPRGITCTTERHIEGNIIDFINYPKRIFPIGRLDKDSEGLILLTDDGSIVNKILAKENHHEKDYIVTVNKKITPDFLYKMSAGVKIYNPVRNEYTLTNRCKVSQLSAKQFKITLTQGLNRQIRRMCSAFDYQVVQLKRIRIMNIYLKDLKIGTYRELTSQEKEGLLKSIK